MKPDLIITGGLIVDGSGGAPFTGAVAVRDGRIEEVGPIAPAPEVPVLDAAGLVVAPGFMDIHSHSDFTLYNDPRAVSALTQGVTLEVVGNCGHGCAPITTPELFQQNIFGYEPGMEMPWRTVGQYLDALTSRRPAVNVAALVPNGNLRLAVVGHVERPATADERARMGALLTQGMEEGAWGYSTGLEYATERGAGEAEVAALCRIAAAAGGFYATHTRNRPGEARETIEEAIQAAACSGIPLQISHISSISRLEADRRGAIVQGLEQVDRARTRGLDVSFDMHTRTFGMTTLSNALPPWAVAGTRADIAARLRSRTTRDKMRGHRGLIDSLAQAGWDKMLLYNCPAHPELERQSIDAISRRLGVEPFDAICEVLREEIDNLHSVLALGYVYDPELTEFVFDHPWCLIGSDATTLAVDMPLRGSLIQGAFSWAAWFFRHFVRDTKRLTLAEAVRRLTSLPAWRVGLKDRGRIAAGAWADLAIFDPETFCERGTDFEPGQVAVGMRHVLVNGKLAMRDGRLLESRSGQVLRHVRG